MKRKIFLVVYTLLLTAVISTAQEGGKKSAGSSVLTSVSPKNFGHADIGNPSIPGSVKLYPDGFDIIASGADIWGQKDEFTFVYSEYSGDFDIAVRIESFSAANLYSKAGIMAREELTPSCRHIYFQAFSDNNQRNHNNGGYEFQYRLMKDSSMKAIYPAKFTGTPEFPVMWPNTWIRLRRTADSFTGYCSNDGKSWQMFTTFSLPLPRKLYLGLAVTSHNPSHCATAKFRNLSEIRH